MVCLYRSNLFNFQRFFLEFSERAFYFSSGLILIKKPNYQNFRTPPSAFHRKCGLIIRLDSSVARLPHYRGPWLCAPPFRCGLPLSEFVFYFRYYIIITFLNCQVQNCKLYPPINSLFFNRYFNRPTITNIGPEILSSHPQIVEALFQFPGF